MTVRIREMLRRSPLMESEFPEEAFAEVRRILLEKIGFDLGVYKDRCIRRRVAKRARTLGLGDAESYLALLRRDPGEPQALLAALTIHVSQFFRNPSTFAALKEKILPELFERALVEGGRELRLWSVGCAGGEEPYSLALLVHGLAPRRVKVTILGTDLSQPILERARGALFDPLRLSQVPPPMLTEHFRQEGRNFRLAEPIRSLVRFHQHDLLVDGAYPKADLILCRNVLIYFSRARQQKILSGFASSLPPGGFLVLGRAENLLGESRRHFVIENPDERIYRRQLD